MSPLLSLGRQRLHVIRNRLRALRRDEAVKVAFIACGLSMVALVVYAAAYFSFHFIERYPAIGPPLNERLLSLFFLILLVMVALSTAVVSYTTLFLSGETEFLFQHPLPPRAIFFAKLGEAVALSVWATLVLGIPVLGAFGQVRAAPLLYYLETGPALLVFLAFCGCLGSGLTLILLEFVRRWTWRRVFAAAAVLVALPAWLFLRSFDFGGLNGQNNLQVLDQFARGSTALTSPFFPGYWTTMLVVAASGGNHQEVLFQGGVLLANTLIWLPLFAAYGVRRYGPRWLSSRDPAAVQPNAAGRARAPARSPGLPRLLGPTAALVKKDLVTFVRDPAQLTQFILFVLLLAVYVVSLLQIPRNLFGEGWKLVIYFANLAAISLILSSFTSRFLFPLLSLEGRSFWIVGLAPVERGFLVRQKALLGGAVILLIGLTAGLASTVFLGFEGDSVAAALFTIALAGTCLTSLAAGLGAAYPSLGEDNPARIAVGLGGTLNFFASAGAVLVLLAIEGAPYLPPWPRLRAAVPLAHLLALLFTLLVSWYALRLGQRAVRDMEF